MYIAYDEDGPYVVLQGGESTSSVVQFARENGAYKQKWLAHGSEIELVRVQHDRYPYDRSWNTRLGVTRENSRR